MVVGFEARGRPQHVEVWVAADPFVEPVDRGPACVVLATERVEATAAALGALP